MAAQILTNNHQTGFTITQGVRSCAAVRGDQLSMFDGSVVLYKASMNAFHCVISRQTKILSAAVASADSALAIV
jgi:hypothetical protein